jgi:hypothetical protein
MATRGNKLSQSALMRAMVEQLIHGERVIKLADFQTQAPDALAALNRAKAVLDREYGYSGWERLRISKKSRLHIDPVHQWPTPSPIN